MTIRVSTVVMAHPKRRAFVTELLTRLDRPAEVVWDERDDRWHTGRRAMLAYQADATHHLVVQDDAIIPRDLVAGVEQALAHVPAGAPLCLYCGRVRPYRELVQQLVDRAGDNTSWLTMSQLHWGVGIVMPTDLIGDMISWCDGRTEIANYDRRISRWLGHQNITTWYPWPSLVDHRGSASLVPGRTAIRRAHWFVGADRSALDCRWDGKVVSIPALGGVRAQKLQDRKGNGRVKFISTKYPQLQVSKVGARFRGGQLETTNPATIEELLKLRHLGVEPAEPVEPVEATTNGQGPQATDIAEPTETTEAEDNPEAGVDEGGTGDEDDEEPPADEDTDTATDGADVPAGGAKDVLNWVGADPARARQAMDTEQAREKPRTTLVATLAKIAG